MLRKLGFAELAKAILDALRERTPYPCYDAIPLNTPSPLVFVEVNGKEDSSTKTMYKETFSANVHLIANPNDARTEIYKMIQDVEEALTQQVRLPPCVTLILQTESGVNSFQQDETNEWHAVLTYEFMVSYGFRVKAVGS